MDKRLPHLIQCSIVEILGLERRLIDDGVARVTLPDAKLLNIHLVHNSGFAGAHPRKSYLYLNLRTDYPIDSPRITKTEQVSKNRFHNELKLSYPDEIDEELLGWLKDAYALG